MWLLLSGVCGAAEECLSADPFLRGNGVLVFTFRLKRWTETVRIIISLFFFRFFILCMLTKSFPFFQLILTLNLALLVM